MTRIKVSKNFHLDEFIDPYTYLKTEDHGLSLIDDRLFNIAQLLRDLSGKPIPINNWWYYYQENKEKLSCDDIIKDIESNSYLEWNGKIRRIYKWSGTRTNRTNEGSPKSAHRQFKAIDPKGNQNEMFEIIKSNAKKFYKLGVRRLEDPKITPGWLHLDTLERNTKPNSIRVIDLNKATQIITW